MPAPYYRCRRCERLEALLYMCASAPPEPAPLGPPEALASHSRTHTTQPADTTPYEPTATSHVTPPGEEPRKQHNDNDTTSEHHNADDA